MIIDYLPQRRHLMFDEDAITEGGKRAADYFRKFVRALEEEWLLEIQRRMNAMIDQTAVEYIYFGLKDGITGTYADGTWRIGANDDGQFVRQKKVSGDWVTEGVFDV